MAKKQQAAESAEKPKAEAPAAAAPAEPKAKAPKTREKKPKTFGDTPATPVFAPAAEAAPAAPAPAPAAEAAAAPAEKSGRKKKPGVPPARGKRLRNQLKNQLQKVGKEPQAT